MFKRLSLALVVALVPAAVNAQDSAKKRLDASPRHQEWVSIKNGARTVQAFVVYPEASRKTPVILVIHENMGLTDWVRGLADQLAEAGYIAVAPDLLSGYGSGGGKTTDFASPTDARDAISKLTPDGVTSDLNAVADYAKKIPASNGKIAVSGFCWGGGQSFRFATNRPELAAAFVFYGSPPDKDAMARIKAPVYGFYGGADARIDATIPTAQEQMKALGKTYEPVTYEGAGHGFMRSGEDPEGSEPNRKGRNEAWTRWKALLAKL
ncbi:MAG: carboxymethylenebutenolidase [Acidobacteria bacterium]|nr:MAG: carboxymethylenebutenolidase [Acidobacteriota bacterium]